MKIPYSKVQSSEEAFSKVKELITPEYVKKFGIKSELTYDEAGKKIISKGKGFTLTVSFHEDACECDLDLSFMMKAFAGPVMKKIEAEVKQYL